MWRPRPTACVNDTPGAGHAGHSNHFLDPLSSGSKSREASAAHSYTRLARLRELLDARRPASIGDAQGLPADHTTIQTASVGTSTPTIPLKRPAHRDVRRHGPRGAHALAH